MKTITERVEVALTRAGNNASHTARVAYGGTPISIRVRGHKKKVKLKPFLDRIDRIWDQWLEKEISQIEREVDGYLRRLGRGVKDGTRPEG